MNRVETTFHQHFSKLCQALGQGGALLVSLDEAKRPNAMTIGWAQVGIIWGKPICTVLVRPSRYTFRCCNTTGDFTVNLPRLSQAEQVLFCGTKSGRDYDKFAECGFTPVPPRAPQMSSPFIAECGLAYECRVVHYNDVLPPQLAPEIQESCYPSGDYHRIYFGEILSVHGVEDLDAWLAG